LVATRHAMLQEKTVRSHHHVPTTQLLSVFPKTRSVFPTMLSRTQQAHVPFLYACTCGHLTKQISFSRTWELVGISIRADTIKGIISSIAFSANNPSN